MGEEGRGRRGGRGEMEMGAMESTSKIRNWRSKEKMLHKKNRSLVRSQRSQVSHLIPCKNLFLKCGMWTFWVWCSQHSQILIACGTFWTWTFKCSVNFPGLVDWYLNSSLSRGIDTIQEEAHWQASFCWGHNTLQYNETQGDPETLSLNSRLSSAWRNPPCLLFFAGWEAKAGFPQKTWHKASALRRAPTSLCKVDSHNRKKNPSQVERYPTLAAWKMACMWSVGKDYWIVAARVTWSQV